MSSIRRTALHRNPSRFPLPLALILGFLLAVPSHAEVKEARPGPDPAIKAQLEALDYKYQIDEDGDFKLVFEIGEEGRSQIVYVLSTVESYGELEVREIWSPAYTSPTEQFPAVIANRLLEASNQAKLGGWVKQGKNAIFVIKIPADASKDVLDDATTAAMELADEMENELTPGQDEL
jgi:hypothetical protein